MPKIVYFSGASALLLTLADAAAKYASLTLLGDERSIILIPGAFFLSAQDYGALANIQCQCI